MFSIPSPNIIESQSGYSVEVLGRTGLLYTEGGRFVRIDSEVLAGPSGIVIYTDSILLWQGSGSATPLHIDETEKKRIIENIKAAFRFRGFDIEVN